MTGTTISAAEGAKLWRRARDPWRDTAGETAPPDDQTLAAYLDGKLDETAAGTVESWLAGAPGALDGFLAIRAGLGAAPDAAPAHVIARAQAIIHAPGIAAGKVNWWRNILSGPGGSMAPGLWAGAAAAVLLASVSGFELGRAGVEHLAALDATVAQDVRMVMGHAGQDLL